MDIPCAPPFLLWSDIKQFTDLLKKGDAKMLIINSQEPSDMTDQLISAADSGNVRF